MSLPLSSSPSSTAIKVELYDDVEDVGSIAENYVDKKILCVSEMLKNMINFSERNYEENPVNLEDIELSCFNLIVEYCGLYLNFQKNPKDEEAHEKLRMFKKKFLRPENDGIVFTTFMVASFLEISSLEKMIRNYLRDEIRGKTPEQLMERFHLECDLTTSDKNNIIKNFIQCGKYMMSA